VLERDELIEHVEHLLSEGEPERAWALCRRGLKKFPRDADLWICLGDSLFEAARLDDAFKAFRKASEIKPQWAVPVARRAEILVVQGQLGAAREHAELAHSLNKDLAHASYAMALCCDLEGTDGVADFWYHRAHKLSPDRFYAPARVDNDTFRREFRRVLEHLRESPEYGRFLRGGQWMLKDRVERNLPDLSSLSPVTHCHLVSEESIPGDEGDSWGPTLIRGYIFRRNILRGCRTQEDLYDQISVSILEQIDDLSLSFLEECGELM